MYRFLVIGGLHGNEPLGLEVCRQLEKLNLPYIDVLYGNPQAIKKNIRYIEEDLNRAFPGKASGSLEAKRALKIMEVCKNYDFVIDFHNTHCPDNDCTFLGSRSPGAYQLASFLGFDKVVQADAYDSINKYVTNCLSVEVSLSSPLCNASDWVDKMVGLKDYNPKEKYGRPQTYEFVYRITREEQYKFNFPKWEAFRAVPKGDLRPLNLKASGVIYPIFIDDAYTPYNYAALIRKMSVGSFFSARK